MTVDWAKTRQEVVDRFDLKVGSWYDVIYTRQDRTIGLRGVRFYENGIYGLTFIKPTRDSERTFGFDGTEIVSIEKRQAP